MTLQKLERQKCEVFSRCVGYFAELSRFNKGKLQEYKDRKNYKIK